MRRFRRFVSWLIIGLIMISAIGCKRRVNKRVQENSTPAESVSEGVTPSPIDNPTATPIVSPTVTPTEEVTPSPTPMPLDPNTIIKEEEGFKLEYTPAKQDESSFSYDSRLVSKLKATYRKPDGSVISFDSGKYKTDNKDRWDSLGFLDDFEHSYLRRINMTEVLLDSYSFGEYGCLDVFLHKGTGFIGDNRYGTNSITVDYWFIDKNMQKIYGVLYQKNKYNDDLWCFEPFYSNGTEGEGNTGVKYDEKLTEHVFSSCTAYASTSIAWFEDGRSEKNYGGIRGFYRDFAEDGAGTYLMTIDCKDVIKGSYLKIYNDSPADGKSDTYDPGFQPSYSRVYREEGAEWNILNHKLSDLTESFIACDRNLEPLIDGFRDCLKENVYCDKTDIGNCVSLFMEMSADTVRNVYPIDIYMECSGVRLLADSCVANPVTYLNGTEQKVGIAYYKSYDLKDSVLTVRQYNGKNELTDEFSSNVFLAENKGKFTKNAKSFLTELKNSYNKNLGKDGSRLAVKNNLLYQSDCGGTAKLYVYENAAYGNVPPETGNGSVYGYEVSYYLVLPNENIRYGVLYRYDESSGTLSDGQHDVCKFNHCFSGLDNDGILQIADIMHNDYYVPKPVKNIDEAFYYAEIGREFRRGGVVDEFYPWDDYYNNYESYFLPDGTRIIDMYDTWRISTDYYIRNGGFITKPDGKVIFEEKHKSNISFQWIVEGSVVTKEELAANSENHTIKEISLTSPCKLSFSAYNGGHYFEIYLKLEKDGQTASYMIYEYRFIDDYDT
ncbi:MAG: hypothetical protein J5643_00290 [Lachnospiraceae bacterium]|nr:hypothetical protein [Lachnospiraceae bacterium]